MSSGRLPSFIVHRSMLLALDTATRHAGIALWDGHGLVAEMSWRSADGQTTELLPRLQQLLAWQQVEPAALSAVAVSLGPGSFTGLRVALSVAKGLALAHHLALIGIPTLDATAYPHLGHAEAVCAVVQAGRGRVYWSIYGPSQVGLPAPAEPVQVGPWTGWRTPHVLSDVELLRAEAGQRSTVVGELPGPLRAELSRPTGPRGLIASPCAAQRRAGCLAELGWRRLQAGQADDAETLTPIYAREP